MFQYLKTLKLTNADVLNIFSGFQYLPLDSQTFLKVQSVLNLVESSFPIIEFTTFLYNDHIIW